MATLLHTNNKVVNEWVTLMACGWWTPGWNRRHQSEFVVQVVIAWNYYVYGLHKIQGHRARASLGNGYVYYAHWNKMKMQIKQNDGYVRINAAL